MAKNMKKTKFKVADNTGALSFEIIRRLGQLKEVASLGDVVVGAVKEARPDGLVKKGTVQKAVIVRRKKHTRRNNGELISFDDNAVVIIDNNKNPRGTRVFGPVARELKELGFGKILSLAPEVL